MQMTFDIDMGEVVNRDKTSDEWFTPKYIADWLGPIAFDPCANPKSKVVAEICGFLSERYNGLVADWALLIIGAKGIVFVNPPYSDCSSWLDKCAEEARNHPEMCIVALVPAYSGDAYWHRNVWGCADWVAYHRGRVRFDTENGPAKDAASFTSALVGWNDPDGQHLIHIANRAKSRLFFVDAKRDYRNYAGASKGA